MIADAAWVVPGLVAGGIHFSLLRWNTVMYARSGQAWLAAAVQAARMAGLGGLLAMAALHGALPLLLMALGVLIARPVVMRWGS
jgi:hypothetical protein